MDWPLHLANVWYDKPDPGIPIVCLIPLALRGVRYRAVGAARLLRDNLMIYGVGGVIAPFAAIKLIDLLLSALHLA